jgi:hypothetical protein
VNRTGLLLLRVLNAEPHNIAKNILCIRFENRQGCASIPITGLMMTDRQATRARVHKSASHVICPFDHASLGSYLPLSWSECRSGVCLQETIGWKVFLMWINCNKSQGLKNAKGATPYAVAAPPKTYSVDHPSWQGITFSTISPALFALTVQTFRVADGRV